MSLNLSSQSRRWNRIRWITIAAFVVMILPPFLYMILVSLSPDAEVGGGNIFPSHLTVRNYFTMWGTISLADNIGNSFFISLCAGILATLLALGVGYFIARFRFKGRKVFLVSLVTLHTAPQVMLLLPLFVIIAIIQRMISIHVIGQYYTIILTYMTFSLPFACWLILSHMANVPIELEESGFVDGASRFQVLRLIVFPLMIPGLVVSFVFSFLLSWGDVLFASVLTVQSTRTVAVGLQAYIASGEQGNPPLWGQLMAASLASGIPIVIVFYFFQRYIIGGLTSGAVKG